MALTSAETRKFGGGEDALKCAIREVLRKLEREAAAAEETAAGFIIRFPTTLWNWGQRVTVAVDSLGAVTVVSTSANRFQRFDFGRNRWNVRRILDALSAELSGRASADW